MRAVANWVSTHSRLFGDQIPTRSPVSRPAASKPRASSSTLASSSEYDSRTS